MGLDYESRLRLRRVGGVAGPAVLIPLAVWFCAATPSAVLAGAPTDAPAPSEPVPVVEASGLVVRVSVLPDGAYEVVETVRLGEAVRTIALSPPDVSRGGPTFTDAVLAYRDIEVEAQGQDVVAVPGIRTVVAVALGAPSTVVEVRYRVEGAAVRTIPSPDGRALGVVAPLTVATDLLVGFEVSGTPVRSLTCPLLAADRLLCGTEVDGTLRTEPAPADVALVVAQLDLDD